MSNDGIVYVGEDSYIDGTLERADNMSVIPGKPITLIITRPDGTQTVATSVITDVNGKAAFVYTPNLVGNYVANGNFAGDASYKAAQGSIGFTAAAENIPPAVIVSVSGSTYTAQNAASGATISSGSNAASVINAAINSLTSGRTTKQKVQLQGLYSLISTINLANYTVLEVASGGKVAATASLPGHLATAPSGSHDWEIVGGEWDGLRGSRALGGDRQPFRFDYASNARMANMFVHDGTYDNIEFTYGNNITLDAIESSNSNWDNILMAYTSNSLFQNCHVHDSLKSGVYFYCEDDGIAQTVSNNILRNNLVERTLTTGLSISLRGLEDVGNGNTIDNNTCIDCGGDGTHYGINVGWADATGMRRANNNIISNNTVKETGYYAGGTGGGLTIQGDTNKCFGNTIQVLTDFGMGISGDNNDVHDNTVSGTKTSFYAGIMVTDGNSNQIHDNTIFNCPIGLKVEPQYLTGVGNLNHFYNNKISGISGNWFAFGSSGCSGIGCCSGNIFENNTVTGNHNYSTVGSKNTTVQNNTYN